MFYKRIFTESIAQYSYVIGDGKELVVIDPQPEMDIYLDIAREKGQKITKILETHRNEDFLVGSKALSDATGATVYISSHDDLEYEYGEKISDGHVFQLNGLAIKALHTPGHTLGHMSYALYFKDNPYMVFVGDTCFYGDIGRTDFYGEENLDKMTGKIYDSIFNVLLPLGDDVIMCPAHGAGSACGENTEERPSTTLGYERKHNPKLQYKTKEEFVKENGIMLYKPAYFTYMEEMNLKGVGPIDCNSNIAIKYLDDLNLDEEYIVDIRSQTAYNDAHIPGSIYMMKSEMMSFINWIVPRDADICLVSNRTEDLDQVYEDLKRIGYTGNISFLSGSIMSWIKANKETESIPMVMPSEYEAIKDKSFILDIRKESEVEGEADYKHGTLIPMEEITERYSEVEDEKNIIVICPSGIRSNVSASFLKRKGIDVSVLIGGLEALK